MMSKPPVTVQLGPRRVGQNEPVMIVAEAGVNHDGCVETAVRLVDAAAIAGADAVKFQMFRADELATADATLATYQRGRGVQSQRDMLRRLELSDADFARLAAHCRMRQIEFLVTPFSPPDVDRLCDLDVHALKIASTDLNNTLLLRRAVSTGLPLILSTGASQAGEIAAALARLRSWNAGTRLVLLHCISGYPAPLAIANLRAIATLSETFGVPVGFSDHTESTDVAGWAVAAGACVLEKHFTLDRSASGPDHAMSLDPVQLATYIATARAAETALGTGTLGMSPLEADVRAVARKSVVAATRIPAGVVITPEMLTAKRPAGGIDPDRVDTLVGSRATVDIDADTVLQWEMVQ
jgi:N,N'-diacetyllegionaminate synthase